MNNTGQWHKLAYRKYIWLSGGSGISSNFSILFAIVEVCAPVSLIVSLPLAPLKRTEKECLPFLFVFFKKVINYKTLLDKLNTILYSGVEWYKVA